MGTVRGSGCRGLAGEWEWRWGCSGTREGLGLAAALALESLRCPGYQLARGGMRSSLPMRERAGGRARGHVSFLRGAVGGWGLRPADCQSAFSRALQPLRLRARNRLHGALFMNSVCYPALGRLGVRAKAACRVGAPHGCRAKVAQTPTRKPPTPRNACQNTYR